MDEQSQHTTSCQDSRATQRGRILHLLLSARGGWVPLPEITQHAAQYNARIYELRRLGFPIENHRERVNGELHTAFRLVPGPAAAKPVILALAREISAVAQAGFLFPDIQRDPEYPD